MKKLAITVVFTLLFGLVALAQSSSPQYPNNPNNPSSRPQSTTPDTSNPNNPSSMPSTSPEAQQTQTQSNDTSMKGERKLKGCIVSEGGQFFLEKKNGDKVELSSTQDLSAHVGHTVTVHGTMEGGSSASATAPSSAGGTSTSSASAGGKFTVSKLDMVSESCTNKK